MSVTDPEDQALGRQRIDKWLWYARFFKSRSAAGRLCAAGRVRINQERCRKASQTVAPGDVLTFPQARRIRVVRILAPGCRRGPAPEAGQLYEDLSVEVAPGRARAAAMPSPGGRPGKRDRRAIARLKGRIP